MGRTELIELLKSRGEKVSQAERIRNLITLQKKLMGAKQNMVDFKEPLLFLDRRNGNTEFYDNATMGAFVFTHSTGKERVIELRPSDQRTLDYAGKKVRYYHAHEDRPFAGYENPIIDGEDLQRAFNMIKATDKKYEESMEKLKNKGKLTIVWILLAAAGAIIAIIFGISTWAPQLWDKLFGGGKTVTPAVPPVAGMILMKVKGKIGRRN